MTAREKDCSCGHDKRKHSAYYGKCLNIDKELLQCSCDGFSENLESKVTQ